MDISSDRVLGFIKRERLYIFLLIFVIVMHLSLSALNQFLEDPGTDGISGQQYITGEGILSEERIAEIMKSDPELYFAFLFLFITVLFFAFIGIILDIVYLALNHRGKSLFARTQITAPGSWDFWDICKVAIIFLSAQGILFIVNVTFLSTIPYFADKYNLKLMLSATTVDIIAIGAIFYFVLKERKETAALLGLTAKRFLSNIKYGIVAYIGLIPILGLVMFLTMILFKIFNIPIEPQPVVEILRAEKHIPSLIYMCFFTAVIGPVFEEIFFRGFVYGVLKKRIGIFWGIAASSAFFAYVHANLASFFPIFCLGVLLVYIYEKTGSLVSSITVHILHNSATLIFLLFLRKMGS